METTFSESFKSFIEDRIITAVEEKVVKDSTYAEVSEQAIEVFKKIKALLPQKDAQLIFRYEDLRTQEGIIRGEYTYKQGLIDGIALCKELRIGFGAEPDVLIGEEAAS